MIELTQAAGHRPGARWRLLVPLLLVVLIPLGGCDDAAPAKDPEDTLADAKKALDKTEGVSISLTTDKLPESVDGILAAKGVGNHSPAFDGELTVSISNLSVEVPVVSVDGKVYAKVPMTTEFTDVDPAEYGAPDPADLMDPDGGISSWLTAATGVEEGEQVREGDTVLTAYTGTVGGPAVADVIPSADSSGTFDATFRIDDDGRLDSARISGPFYGEQGDVDYELELSDYGTEKDITAP